MSRSATTARALATSESGPIGVVLAGGAGRRLGGRKATADLLGRPLIAWPLAAMGAALDDVVVVAKADTVLPDGLTVPVWVEPDVPRHPLAGLRHALACSGGRDILVCAVDLPCVTVATIRRLAWADGVRPVLARGDDGRPQPLLARYPASAAAQLAAAEPEAALTAVALSLDPAYLTVTQGELLNVNMPGDVARAAAALTTQMG